MSDHDRSEFDRREFLQAGAAVTAASALTLGAGSTGLAQDKDKDAKSILPKRRLGKTGVEVTILNAGTGGWRDAAAAPRLMRAAYASGIRYLDTAKLYGTEPAIASFFKAVPEARKETFVVTKDIPNKSPKELIAKLDERLATLQLDSVDMFFFHGLGDNHDTDTCLEFLKGKDFREMADTIKKSGKANFIGFSCHNKDLAIMLETAAKANVVDAIMVKYNAFAPKDHPFSKALDACHAKDIGLISMKQMVGSESMLSNIASKLPQFKDKGLQPYEMLLHAIWTDERISTSCVSLKNETQIAEGAHAARTFKPLTKAELDTIHKIYLASKPTHCAICDGSCSRAAGTDANLGDLTRYLAYHEHNGERAEARRLYSEMADAARDWKGADLAAAHRACPTHLDFAELLPKVDEYLA
jgi:predicted aldo/keto reductase-like oxidoreductase